MWVGLGCQHWGGGLNESVFSFWATPGMELGLATCKEMCFPLVVGEPEVKRTWRRWYCRWVGHSGEWSLCAWFFAGPGSRERQGGNPFQKGDLCSLHTITRTRIPILAITLTFIHSHIVNTYIHTLKFTQVNIHIQKHIHTSHTYIHT